jgi:hypothetical protein
MSTNGDSSRLQFAVPCCYDSAAEALGDLICEWDQLINRLEWLKSNLARQLTYRFPVKN